jgi:branched-chain amino acid transport system permease protein
VQRCIKAHFVALSLIVALTIALPFVLSSYDTGLVSLALIFSIASMAQTLLTGTANQPSLGNSAFLGISAYVMGALTSEAHWPFLAAAVLAVVAAALIGIAVGLPALRISGLYLAIATIALVFVVQEFLTQWDTIQGRASVDVVRPSWLASDRALYTLSLLVAAMLTLLLWNLLRSRVGRAFAAIRDSEVAAEAAGIPLSHYKTLAFALSGAITGIAGVLLAEYYQGVTPGAFSLSVSLSLLAMVVIGGLGSLPGAYMGAFIITLMPYVLDVLPTSIGPFNVHNAAPLLSALLLLLVLTFLPGGLWSLIEILPTRLAAWRSRHLFVRHASSGSLEP